MGPPRLGAGDGVALHVILDKLVGFDFGEYGGRFVHVDHHEGGMMIGPNASPQALTSLEIHIPVREQTILE